MKQVQSSIPLIVVKVVALVLLGVQPAKSLAEQRDRSLPQRLELGPGKSLGKGPDQEHSGIVKSRQWPNLFWMHNDSGDEPRIYPIGRDGSVRKSDRYPHLPGVEIAGAINVDWEDIAIDGAGNVVVADIGNNGNDRRDLALYVIPEPAPHAGRTIYSKRILFRYPGQSQFPSPKDDFNYDAEALFIIGSDAFICSKNRSNTRTDLYRIEMKPGAEVQVAELVDSFDVKGQATGADATEDGKRIVICTYSRLWLFDVTDSKRPLSGPARCLEYENDDDIEAICFADSETLIVGAEASGKIFEVQLSEFERIPHLK